MGAVYHKQTTMFSVPCDFRCTAMVEAVATLVPKWILKSKLNNFWYPVRYSLTLREILLVSPSFFLTIDMFFIFPCLHHDFTRCLSFSSLPADVDVTISGWPHDDHQRHTDLRIYSHGFCSSSSWHATVGSVPGKGNGFVWPEWWGLRETVDGQNPAPPRMMIIPSFIGF